MKKIAVNKCYGGFSLSPKAESLYAKKLGKTAYFYYSETLREPYIRLSLDDLVSGKVTPFSVYTITEDLGETCSSEELNRSKEWLSARYIERDDPKLIEVIEELGEDVNNRFSAIEIVEIPDDVEWQIEEYDGREWVAEKHRTW